MFNGNLPGYMTLPEGQALAPQAPAQSPYGGHFSNLPFFNGGNAPMPGNTGIVPPQMQPVPNSHDMYRQFIRGRLGIGGDPGGAGQSQMGYGAGGGRPIQPWIDRPRTFNEPMGGMGAGAGHPIVDWAPRPRSFQEPMGVGGMHSVPHENRPGGVGGYNNRTPGRSLYDEIG